MIELIAALGGDNLRYQKAAELFRTTKPAYCGILFTSGSKEQQAQWYAQYGVSVGIESRVHALNTFGDILEILDAMKRFRYKSCMIVDSDYHLERTKLIVSILAPKGYTFYYTSVPSSGQGWARWASEFFARLKVSLGICPTKPWNKVDA